MLKIYYKKNMPKGFRDALVMKGIGADKITFLLAPEKDTTPGVAEFIADRLGDYTTIHTVTDQKLIAVL